MKTTHDNHGSHATEHRTRSPKTSLLLTAAALLLPAADLTAQVTTFDVNLQSAQFNLYTDPYNGNEIKVGGFSGLYPVPGKPGSFYAITDRGPTPDFKGSDGKILKTWAVPGFGPHLITVRLMPNGTAKIDEVKPLKRPNGGHITGLPTTKPATDIPYDFDLNVLPFDEDSLDAEGITIDPWGNLWVCEEYKPSVAMIAPNGKVQMRLVPAGTVVGTEEVPTYPVLPGVLAKRRSNRGFEGITVSAEGILYAIVQRPLSNPRAAADANGNVRLVAIDLNTLGTATPPVIRQYLYQVPPIIIPPPPALPIQPLSMTVSDLFSTGPGKMLVPERATDKLFEIDVTNATDITPFEDPVTFKLLLNPAIAPNQTFEQLDAAEIAAIGIVPVSKTVVIDSLTAISPLLEKVEGVCKIGNTIYLTYDNDFNVAEAGSTPANPNPNGPFVQLELLGANYPKIWAVQVP